MRVSWLVVIFLVLGVTLATNKFIRRAHVNQLSGTTEQEIANYVLSAMNQTIDPCADFYDFSCGTWISTFVLPPSDSSYPRNIGQISANNNDILISICQNPANGKVSSNLR